jgi:putative two-component system response regulator
MLWEEIRQAARILIVSDAQEDLEMLHRMFESAYYKHVRTAGGSGQIELIIASYQPDLIVLDTEIRDRDAYEVMERIQSGVTGDEYLPVIAVVPLGQPEDRLRALIGGARDVVDKPFDRLELMLRARLQLEARFLAKRLLAARMAALTRALELVPVS